MSSSNSHGQGGAAGASAGQDAKGVFNAAKGFTEELRGNINSFADTTVGTHGRADKDRHGVVADGTSRQGTSTGMSKDAEALGQGLKNAVGGSGSGSTTTSTTK